MTGAPLATYLTLRDSAAVTRTVTVSDLVMVDLDVAGEPIGVEFAVPPSSVTDAMLDRVAGRFPAIKEYLLPAFAAALGPAGALDG